MPNNAIADEQPNDLRRDAVIIGKAFGRRHIKRIVDGGHQGRHGRVRLLPNDGGSLPQSRSAMRGCVAQYRLCGRIFRCGHASMALTTSTPSGHFVRQQASDNQIMAELSNNATAV